PRDHPGHDPQPPGTDPEPPSSPRARRRRDARYLRVRGAGVRPMTAILEATGVTKVFGGLRALHEVDLTIGEGEIFSLIGPNGAGKTTFFNMITGIYPPTAGSVRFKGEELLKPAPV